MGLRAKDLGQDMSWRPVPAVATSLI